MNIGDVLIASGLLVGMRETCANNFFNKEKTFLIEAI
jgi:hypothetical protein